MKLEAKPEVLSLMVKTVIKTCLRYKSQAKKSAEQLQIYYSIYWYRRQVLVSLKYKMMPKSSLAVQNPVARQEKRKL